MIIEFLAICGMVALAGLAIAASLKTWELFDRLSDAERSIKQLRTSHEEFSERLWKIERKT